MASNEHSRIESAASDGAGLGDVRPTQGVELTRRQALVLLGSAGVATLGGCGLNLGGATGTTDDGSGTSGSTDCVLTPAQTEGPYFVDERLNRADIRVDPTDGLVQAGVPLRLKLTVAEVNGSTCSPVAGAQVDVWHCNAQGVYSDVAANGTTGKKFLRGYQVTDGEGAVEFMTIYPGWYSGRTVHIHFKVRVGTTEFTSQLYFDEAVTSQVFAQSPYSGRGQPNTTNARDGIFQEETVIALTPESEGYGGTFRVGVRLS